MTRDELMAFIDEKVGQEHDYNTSADALWQTAEATFNYVASELGATGFQASYAALKLLGKINGYNCPFAVVKAEELVFPQYDVAGKVAGWLESWKPWAADEARKKLAESDPEHVHPDVWSHWERLAATGLTVQLNDGQVSPGPQTGAST